MYNSAVVIGVGGTGRWVLTQLRARILATPGRLPGQPAESLGAVRLIGFDIDSQNAYEFAGHTLSESELVYSTPEIADVIKNIRDVPGGDPRARYQEVREWISKSEAESYDLALLNDFMEDGAGQMRQWGRLGVVLAKGLYDRIRTSVGDLAMGGQVNVYVTGSLCGGTGSATLFDTAAIVHDVLRQVAPGTPARMIGVFLLPAGMTHDVNPAEFPWLEACAFASMRELDRFQRATSRNQIKHDGREITLDKRLFDLCYLLDGVREQQGGVVQDVINTKASLGVDPAMADLIFGYLNPASAQTLDADATNAVSHVGGSHPFKYSKFGTYTLWSPLPLVQRSLAIDDAVDVLAALTDQSVVGEVPSLVSTPELTYDDAGQKRTVFNAQVFLAARRYLSDRNARTPRAAEILPWLLPANPQAKPKIPAKPDYANREFPDIKKVRTPYENPEVKQRVEKLLNEHLADIRHLTEAHRREVLADFRTYLLVQCRRIATEPALRAGLARSRAALVEIETVASNLRQRFTQLNEMEAKSGRLTELRLSYRNAQTAMDDNNRWDDAFEQRDLFEAANRLMEAELDAQTRATLIDLMEQLSKTIADVRDSEIYGWQRTLENLTAQTQQASAELDRVWAEHKSVVVRRVLLDRHSGLETAARQRLTDKTLEQLPADRRATIPSTAAAFVEQQLSWVVGRKPGGDHDTLMLRGPWNAAHPEIEINDLLGALETAYAFVLDTPFGEAVEHSSVPTAELASDIRLKTSLLTSSAPEPGAPPKPLPIQNVLLFGSWGDGSAGTTQLKNDLAAQGFDGGGFTDTLQLTAADAVAAQGVALNQHLWILRTQHGASINGFGKTDSLRERYLSLRGDGKPLHIFPEEQAASLIEEQIQVLIGSGELSGVPGLLGPEGVGLAREGRILRQVALLIASQRLSWQFDTIDQEGKWQLLDAESASIRVVSGKSSDGLLPGLLDHASRQREPASRRILEALDAAAREEGGLTDASREMLVRIAAGTSDQVGVADQSSEARLLLGLSSRSLLA